LRLLVMSGAALLLAGCPQGSSTDDPTQDFNSQLTGNYLIQQVGRNAFGPYTTQVAVTSNGDGTGTYNILKHSQFVPTPVPVPFTYSTAGDGTFTMNNGAGTDYGTLSSDGNKMIIVDAVNNPPDTDNEIIFSIGLKSDCTVTTPLSGQYHVGRFEINYVGMVPVISTARIDVTYVNATTGNYNIAQHSGTLTGAADNFTFTQNSDCTLTVDDGIGDIDNEIAAADGSVYVLTDTDNGDNLLSLVIGVRKSSIKDNTLFNGSYRLGVFAEETQLAVKTIFSSEVKVSSAGDGTATADVIKDSLSPPATGIPLTYVVNGDGTFSVTNTVATDFGIVSGKGDFIMLVDADHADTDTSILLTTGIRP